MGKKHIAIDLGAESGRVMVGELSDSGITLAEVHRFANTPLRGSSSAPENREVWQWDIARLWDEIKIGLGKIVAQFGAEQIASAGVDTWGVDFALLDGRGELLENPFCYRDARTKGMADTLFERIGRDRVYAITGIQTMEINTLFQLASMSLRGSPQLRGAARILFLPDLLSYWLCGEMATEYTIASTSQMLDARTRAWSPEIFQAIGADSKLFPPIVAPGTRASVRGTILPGVNEHLAAAGVKVISVGAHDTASAVVAVPADATRGDWLYLSSGTWSLLGCEVDEPVLTETARCFDLTNEGGVGGKIRLLKNIPGLWFLQMCRREWSAQGNDIQYPALMALAEGASAHGATLNLADPAFSTPENMPAKIMAYCHQTHQHVPQSHGEIIRVILESLASRYAQVVHMLAETTGKHFKTLHIVGGGSQNHLLNQLAADATGLTVLAGPVEATAMGNIIAQAISLGSLPSIAAGRQLVAKSLAVQPFMPRTRP